MLRWMFCITRRDRVRQRDDCTIGSVELRALGSKIQESIMGWFGHI